MEDEVRKQAEERGYTLQANPVRRNGKVNTFHWIFRHGHTHALHYWPTCGNYTILPSKERGKCPDPLRIIEVLTLGRLVSYKPPIFTCR
jgi:hypothetical protein